MRWPLIGVIDVTATFFKTDTNPFFVSKTPYLMALVCCIHLNPVRAGLVSESAQLVMLFRDTRTWDDQRGVGRTAAFGTADRKPIRSARAKNSFSRRIGTAVIINQ